MKSSIAFFVVILLMIISCTKNHCAKYYWGTINSLKNGMAWTADIRADKNNRFQGKFDITMHKFISSCTIDESLGFQNIPSILGRYRLFKIDFNYLDSNKTVAHFITTVGGDATCDWYDVVETDSINNYIQVNSFDPGTRKVSGIFSVKLAVKLPKCDQSSPDTLLFSNGSFYTKVFD